MKSIIALFSITLLLIVFGCGVNNKITGNVLSKKDTIIDYKNIAFAKYGNDTTSFKSPNGNYMLCKKKLDKTSLNPYDLLFFFVFDIKKGEVIYEDKIAGAKVTWKSDYRLLIKKQKGIVKDSEDKGQIIYIYNLKANKKEALKTKPNNK